MSAHTSHPIDPRANAALEPWKRATLADAIAAVDDAVQALRNNGVQVPTAYAPVAVAQLLLESAWGRSTLAQLGKNYFGLKARPGDPVIVLPTTEHLGGSDVRLSAAFRRFDSMAACCVAHARLLCTAAAYAGARAHGDDPIAFARALDGVYATDPQYSQKLIAVLRDRGLLTTFQGPLDA